MLDSKLCTRLVHNTMNELYDSRNRNDVPQDKHLQKKKKEKTYRLDYTIPVVRAEYGRLKAPPEKRVSRESGLHSYDQILAPPILTKRPNGMIARLVPRTEESTVPFHSVRNVDELQCAQIYYGTSLAYRFLGKISDPTLESFYARRKNDICMEMVPKSH